MSTFILHILCIVVCTLGSIVHAQADIDNDTSMRWFDYSASLGLYGARYSNPATSLGFHDLVGSAPRDGIRLNIISASLRGRYDAGYGALSLQEGDYPRAAWMTNMYWLEEGYIGMHLSDNVRIEVGAFSSHVGVESMKLTENFSGIISLPGFFDPNYFGGIKTYWSITPSLELQADIVTSFNGFELEEGSPAFTSGVTWTKDSSVTISGNVFFSRETIDQRDQSQLYLNTSASIELPDVHILGELNYAVELPDGRFVGQAMMSGFAGLYYDVAPLCMIGGRLEFVLDPYGILADDRFVNDLPYKTLSAGGATATVSYKPLPWCMIRADLRYLTTFDDQSFIETDPNVHQRTEAVVSVDFII